MMTGSDVWVYDTQDHQIGGSSHNNKAKALDHFLESIWHGEPFSLASRFAERHLSTTNPTPTPTPTPSPAPVPAPAYSSDRPLDQVTTPSQPTIARHDDQHDILNTLERLGALKEKGYITDEEFARKKAELLSRL